jgi:hypothetical protein
MRDYLIFPLRVPVAHATTEEIDKEGSDGFAVRKYKRGANKNNSGGNDPIPAAVL